ncbi:MAG: hypothetical protein AAB038_03065 [Planctomycetota bacterium]
MRYSSLLFKSGIIILVLSIVSFAGLNCLTTTDSGSSGKVFNAPSNLRATVISPTLVNLTWVDNSNSEIRFEIWRNIYNENPTFTQIATLGANVISYSDTTVIEGKGYSYVVYAYNAAGNRVDATASYCVTVLWVEIATGNMYNIGRATNGTLWFWGYEYGRTGAVTIGEPYMIGTSTNWKQIVCGLNNYRVGLKTDNTLWSWWWNDYSQLGLGDSTDRSSPTKVGIDTNWSALAAGYAHTVALKTDGTLWSWGYNEYGQLGNNTYDFKTVPTQITGTTWSAIAAGAYHTVALSTTGAATTLWA